MRLIQAKGLLGGLVILPVAILVAVTLADARDVRVTIYNSNLGVVRDVRSTKLDRGTNEISMDEIAARIDPTSVKLSIDGEGQISVLEQNFEYDLVNPDKLLQKYLDEILSITTQDGKIYEGKLIGFDGGNLVLNMDTKGVALVSRDKVKDIVLPPGEKGLVVKPTLFWRVDASKATSANMEVAYITDGINWHAEYVAAVGDDEKSLGLSAWVSIDNQSGATYPDAKLKLIAGEIHRAEKEVPRPMFELARAGGAPQLEEKPFFEYHMYTLEGTSTIKEKEVKQIQLFPETRVVASKVYNFDASKGAGVRVEMKFENSKKDGLGIPLPAGTVRVFKTDVDKSLEFLGEDQIDHTPRDEEVKLYVGDAFDVVAKRDQKDFNKLSDKVFLETYEISLANHKDTAVVVTVTEHEYGDWTITTASHSYKKTKADEVEFEVPVDANAKTVLSYTVRREI